MMQLDFWQDGNTLNKVVETISKTRLKRYLHKANNNNHAAILLYFWNTELSQSLYLPLQCWEIALRNKINNFLCLKFGKNWPSERKINNILNKKEKIKLSEAIDRQTRKRGKTLQTDQIVADLSLGFWVALLGKNYHQPFGWQTNMAAHIFTDGQTVNPAEIRQLCRDILNLRNRVAHHEPIFHLDLPTHRTALGVLMQSLCPATHRYMRRPAISPIFGPNAPSAASRAQS